MAERRVDVKLEDYVCVGINQTGYQARGDTFDTYDVSLAPLNAERGLHYRSPEPGKEPQYRLNTQQGSWLRLTVTGGTGAFQVGKKYSLSIGEQA